MQKYETMFIIRPDLSEDERKALFNQIHDVLIKNNSKVIQANVWSEKKKLAFPIRKYRDGVYYLVSFTVAPEAITKINYAYKLNEDILRALIIKIE